MKIYLYNNNMTEQSVRQMVTTISYLKYDELYLNIGWKNKLDLNERVKYKNIEEFVNMCGKKAVVFFNIMDGYKLKKIKRSDKLKLVFRPRGIVPEESYYKDKNLLKKFILDIIEKKVIKGTDRFIFLNNAQKDHFINKYPNYVNIIKSSRVLPNVKNIQLKEIKETETKKLRIVYSGGFSQWQNIELIFCMIGEVINKSKFAIVFTVLTFENNFPKAKEYAEKYKIENNITLKYVSPSNLDEELEKHDLGILIRDENIINKTASPFKIFDYLYNGLGLIVTDNLVEQVEEILDKNLYYSVKMENEKLNYSIDQLVSFLLSFKKNVDKKSIVDSYNRYTLCIEEIDI